MLAWLYVTKFILNIIYFVFFMFNIFGQKYLLGLGPRAECVGF